MKDAYDGTLAVTKDLPTTRECLFVGSTHTIEVTDALKASDHIHFSYLPTLMEGK